MRFALQFNGFWSRKLLGMIFLCFDGTFDAIPRMIS
jgi:hypothetical protein